ncbi:hypothetical protein ACIGHG_23505 [Bacillus sp. NPDC077411]|uniref:hypothetical protein n=1 Tax=Bacillus sp. NPDC077411 TaxID=3363947 RepID=UPI0037C5F330
MDHTPEWLIRKNKQALKDKYDKHVHTVQQQMQGYMLLFDSIFNAGRNTNDILPPTLEEAIKQQEERKTNTPTNNDQDQYRKDQWWIKKPEQENV